jgi:hypothetical protein
LIYDGDIPAFDITEIAEALAKMVPYRGVVDDADAPHAFALLCVGSQWPRGCRTTQTTEKFPSPHAAPRSDIVRFNRVL